MLLSELNKGKVDWSKAMVGTLFKQVKSQTDPNTGGLRVDPKGKVVHAPLSSEFGQRKALRDGDGKVIGPGGDMLPNISPQDAKKELDRYVGELQTGQAKPFNELPQHSNTWDALRNRSRRSTPKRPAVWPDGQARDPVSGELSSKRSFTTPDNRRITKSRPYTQKQQQQAQAKAAQTQALGLASPEAAARAKQAEQQRRLMAKKSLGVSTGMYGPRSRSKMPKESTDRFSNNLDEALGL